MDDVFICMFKNKDISKNDWIIVSSWDEQLILNDKVIEDIYWMDGENMNAVYYTGGEDGREPENFYEDVETIEPTKDIFKYIFGDWG